MDGEGKEFYPLVIDIGANDGKRLSNSWTFIVENGWKGILVEPVPQSFEKMVDNYKQSAYQPTMGNFALSDTTGKQRMSIAGEDNMLSMFSPNEPITSDRLNIIEVDCITPQELFVTCNVKDVGVLSVDTEGHDLPIIRSMMNETEVRPQIIITETWPHLMYDTIEKHSLMLREGYTKILHCGENEIFYRSR